MQGSTLKAQSHKTAEVKEAIAVFDPVVDIPQDWMMGWNTPKKTTHKTQHPTATPQGVSLLDTTNEAASPHSIKQFSQKEVEEACQRVREQVGLPSHTVQLCPAPSHNPQTL